MCYSILVCDCANCKKTITVNPEKCPSIRLKNGIPDPTGNREPICKDCFDLWNQIHRTSKGLPQIPLNPKAYQPSIIE